MEEKKNKQKMEKNTPDTLPKEDIKDIQKKLEECEKQCKEYIDGWKRTKADAENEKKQQQKWMEMERISTKRQFIEAFLPVFDSIQSALSQSSEDATLVSGVEQLKTQCIQSFMQFGVEMIDPIGEKFDPHKHEAVAEKEVEDKKKENIIVEVVRLGAKAQDVIIRPAMVYVGHYKKSE